MITETYGLWVLAPAVVAILLAILTRQVVPALVVGILVGAYMMLPFLPADAAFAGSDQLPDQVVDGFRLTAETYIMGAILNPKDGYGHLKIMIFTLIIGFMVGVIGRNGGTAGMVHVIAGKTQSPRRGALTAWFAGLVVFFDDYANTMIVGPTMRSVFDRVKLSRAKLAYIVDSTAAPVASLALIGTWVGAEVGFIQQGIDGLKEVPAFLVLDDQGAVLSGMQAFYHSLPYRFYPILALILVFIIALTRRDFGPMKRSEARAHAEPIRAAGFSPREASDEKDQPPPRWWLGVAPVLALVGVTVAVLVVTGLQSPDTAVAMGDQAAWAKLHWWEQAGVIVGESDAYLSIFYGAILSAVVAVLLTAASRAVRIKDAVDAGLGGMARMFPAVVILILAWGLSQVLQDLMLGEIVGARLEQAQFPIQWAPLAIFLAAALISFATGSSWGTMGILCPMTVTIFAGLAVSAQDLDSTQTLNLFYACVGSVLAGAIFGDHCSPISDTTVLSSIASGCRHEEHVWTQIPYALLTAVVAMGLGDVLCSVYDQPWYYGLAAGTVVLFLFVLIFGRRPKPMALPEPPESQPVPRPVIERRLQGFGPAPPTDRDESLGSGEPTP